MTLALSLLGSLIIQQVQPSAPAFPASELDLVPLPQPGVYDSQPFSALVIVPPGHPDDRMIVAPPETARFEMPIIVPELRLVPRGR